MAAEHSYAAEDRIENVAILRILDLSVSGTSDICGGPESFRLRENRGAFPRSDFDHAQVRC
jgi:hypothetical protein